MFTQPKQNKFAQQQTTINKTAGWKYVLLIALFILGVIYSLPNLYGSDPAVQVSAAIPGTTLTNVELQQITGDLTQAKIPYKTASVENGKHILVRFASVDTRLSARESLLKSLGSKYLVATINVPATPKWLVALNARPMNLGLDLRGGMSLLLQVDLDDVVKRREQNSIRNVGEALHSNHIMYDGIVPSGQGIIVRFSSASAANHAQSVLSNKVPSLVWQRSKENGEVSLLGTLSQTALDQLRQYTMQQTINTLDRRVNELGIGEAAVQQQGTNRVSVDLPGVSDATEAQNILGKTATVSSHLVDMKNDAQQAESSGVTPVGDLLLKDQGGNPILLHEHVVLAGEDITSATSSFSQDTGQPQVQISVAGNGQAELYQTTSTNVGKMMAVVYTETKPITQMVNGKKVITYHKTSTVISNATIDGAFGSDFEITGLNGPEAEQLALLLRAGTLPVPVAVLSESQVGPSMGKQNVHRGKLSVEIGLILVIIFMALYYRSMGVIADIALIINLIFIVAVMSLLGGTMSFPGIAGIILNIGMAVDANVLIFERIREELRNGLSVAAAIHAGYDRAIVTIVDAQLTTLIAAVVLFAIGTGPIKGFAVTLTIGLITSMITAITYTRAIVNYLYGGKALKQLPIGIKINRDNEAKVD